MRQHLFVIVLSSISLLVDCSSISTIQSNHSNIFIDFHVETSKIGQRMIDTELMIKTNTDESFNNKKMELSEMKRNLIIRSIRSARFTNYLVNGTKNMSSLNCVVQSDCPSSAVCFDDHCSCPIGMYWDDSHNSCHTVPCLVVKDNKSIVDDDVCWSWPYMTCSREMNQCICTSLRTYDHIHMKCRLKGGIIFLIIISVFIVLGICLYLCCLCLCHTTSTTKSFSFQSSSIIDENQLNNPAISGPIHPPQPPNLQKTVPIFLQDSNNEPFDDIKKPNSKTNGKSILKSAQMKNMEKKPL